MPVSKRSLEVAPPVPTGLTPYWRSDCGRAVVYVGDCRKVLAQMEPEQFYAVVTDPPYGLEFMGKGWDAPWKADGSTDARPKGQYIRFGVTYGTSDSHGFQAWFLTCAEAILRTAKPGAHLLSFGGTRMWHRMACAVEDAGWEIRDTIMWVYGSGFPKSLDVSKAIDKTLGAERKVVGTYDGASNIGKVEDGKFGYGHDGSSNVGADRSVNVTAPATDAARQWNGWGTALKPAVEPIILARKPLVGTVAANVLEHGTGAMNIDGCRVGACQVGWNGGNGFQNTHEAIRHGGLGAGDPRPVIGRWPANLVMSHHTECKLIGTRASKDVAVKTTSTGEVVSENVAMGGPNYGRVVVGTAQRPDEEVWECHPDCPTQSPAWLAQAGGGKEAKTVFATGIGGEGKVLGGKERSGAMVQTYGDSGSAARFFYTSKAGKSDRPHGNMKIDPKVKLRDDLTPDQKESILEELSLLGVEL